MSTKASHVETDDEDFPSKQLTWRQVAKATGANPKRRMHLTINIKSATKTRGRAPSSKSKVKRNDEEK